MAFKATSNHNNGTSKKSKGRRLSKTNRGLLTARRHNLTKHSGVGVGHNGALSYSKLAKRMTSTGVKFMVPVYRCEAEPLATPVVTNKVPSNILQTAKCLDVTGFIKAARAAYKAECRTSNRAAFTLDAVLAMLAPRQDVAKVRGGLSTANTKVAVKSALVAVTILASVRRKTAKPKPKGGTMSKNQFIKRVARKRRQRRNNRGRQVALTTQQRKAKRLAQAKRQERRAKRRLLAQVIQSQRMVALGVVTRTTKALCATVVQKPIHFSKKVFIKTACERPVLYGQPARKMTAMDFRRRYAEDGAYHRKADVRAAMRALNPDYDPDLWRASRVEVAPQPFSQESAILAAESQAAAIVAKSAATYGAGNLVMMMSDTSSKLHAAIAGEIKQNKVDNEVVKAFESITSKQGVSMSDLSDIIVKHGGIHLCDIKLNDKPGTAIAAIGAAIEGDGPCSLLYPRHDLMKCDNGATIKDWMTYVAKNADGLASEQPGNLTSNQTKNAALAPFGFEAMANHGVYMSGKDKPRAKVNTGYGRLMYSKEIIKVKGMDDGYIYESHRPAVNCHIVLDTGSRPQYKVVANPTPEEITRRALVRDFMLNGATDDLDIYFDDATFISSMSLNAAMSANDGLLYEGKPTGRHLFIAVANVTDAEYWPGVGDRADGQNRYFCNAMSFFYLPWSAAKLLYTGVCAYDKFNQQATGNFPLFPQADKKEVLSPGTISLGKGITHAARSKWLLGQDKLVNYYHDYEQAAGYSNNTKEVMTQTTVETSKPAAEAKGIYAAPAAATAPVGTKYTKLQKGGAAKEIVAYQTGLYNKAFGKLKELTTVEVDKIKRCSLEELAKYLGVGSAAHYNQSCKPVAARLLAYFVWATNTDPDKLDVKSYKWTIEHLKELMSIYRTGAIGITMSDNSAGKDYIELKEVEGGHQLWMAGKPTFDFIGDIVVLHDSQQAIHHTVDLAINDGSKIDVEVSSSFGCFMEIFLRVIVRLIGGNVNVYLDSSLRANVLSAVAKLPSVKLSSHRWNEQNGASEHLLRTTFQVVIKRNYKTITKAGFINTTAGAKTVADEFKVATKLNKRKEKGKVKELNLVAMSTEVMLELARNHALDHHFTKKTYHTGDLGHIDIDLMKQCCPNLFTMMVEWLSGHVTNIQTAAGMVMVLTLKAEKGLKRMTLGKANSATPVNPSEAGFFFYGQKRMMEGCLVSTMLAPTLVAAAGMAFWIGDQANKPTVYVNKTNKYSSGIDFIIDPDTGHPFDLTRGCQSVGDANWTNTLNEYDQWNYLTPDREVMIEGKKPALFSINTTDPNARVASLIVHNRNYNGKLINIKWREVTSVDKNYSNLEIEYTLQWIESDGKLRSITKCQLAIVDESFVRNEFNPSLTNVTADMVLTQDTIKADPLYSYVCLFANAVYHNIRLQGVNANPTIQKLAAIKAETNEFLGLEDPYMTEPLFIDNVSLIAGVYNDFLKACEEAFTHDKGIWFDWCDDLVQCRAMWEYYTNKVEMGGQGWEVMDDPIAVLPELAKLEVPAGSRLVVYREDGTLTEKTNILALVVNEDNVCTRYMQRCAVLCGNEHVTLYNVELYESSTVKESVSNSRMLMPEIKCLDLILKGKRCVTLQKQLLHEGKADVMRTKYLAGAACGHPFSDDLTKVEFVTDANGNYVLANKDVMLALVEALSKANLYTDDALLALDNENFPQFCEAMKDFVFMLPKYEDKGGSDYDGFYDEGGYGWDDYEDDEETASVASKSTHYSVWMPALLSFSKLSNNSDSNQDFVSKFFKEIFKPLFLKGYVKPVDSKLCFLVMKSLLESRETIKFMGGGKNLSAKRIALGDINLGEVHIAYDPTDKSPNTAWNMAKAAGIDVYAALKGEDVYVEATRAPLAGSYISKLVIRRTVHIYDTEGNYIRSEQSIGDKKCRYFLPTAQVGTDVAMPVITDGGDFDGDLGRWCYLDGLTHEDLKAARLGNADDMWEAYMNTRNTALSKPMLAGDNDSYLADHFGIKRFEGNANKTMFSGMQGAMNKAFRSVEQHAKTNAAATLTQNQAVGVAYAVYILGMFLSELFKSVAELGVADVNAMSKAQQALCGENAKTLVLLVAEVYEVMLGGFSKGADAYRTKLLEKTVKGEVPALSPEFIADVESVLDGLGAKTDRAEEVAAVVQLVAIYYSGDLEVEDDVDIFTSQNHWLSLAACIFEMSRGKFDGFHGVVRGYGKESHRLMLTNAISLIQALCAKCEDDAIYDLVCDNFTIYAFRELLLTLSCELTMSEAAYLETRWSKEQIGFFCNFGNDNDGGGDDNTPEPDSDPSDGGDAVDVKATEVVEAEPTVEAATESVDAESTEPPGAVEELVVAKEVESYVKRLDLEIHSRKTKQQFENPFYKALDPSTGEVYELCSSDGHEYTREFYCISEISKFIFTTDANMYDKFDQAKLEGYALYAGKAWFVHDRDPNAPEDYTGFLAHAKEADMYVYHNANGVVEKTVVDSHNLNELIDDGSGIYWSDSPELAFIVKGNEHSLEAKDLFSASIGNETTVEDNFPTYIGEVKHIYPESEATTVVEEPVVTKEVERPILKEKPAAPIVATAEESTELNFQDFITANNLQLKELEWTSIEGRNCLLNRYGRRSRQLLSDEQLLDFGEYLDYLIKAKEQTQLVMSIELGKHYVIDEDPEHAYLIDFNVKFSLGDLNKINAVLQNSGRSLINSIEHVNAKFLKEMEHDTAISLSAELEGFTESYNIVLKEIELLKARKKPIVFKYDTHTWTMISYLLGEDSDFSHTDFCYYWEPVEETEPAAPILKAKQVESTELEDEETKDEFISRHVSMYAGYMQHPTVDNEAATEEVIVNPDIITLETYRALYGDVTFSQAIDAIKQLSNNKVDSKSKNTEDDAPVSSVPTQEESLDKEANSTDIDFDEDELDDLNNLSDFDEGDDNDYDFDIDEDGGSPSPNDGDDFDDDGGMEISDDTESETSKPPAAITQTAAIDLPSSVTAVETTEVEVKPAASKFTQKDIDAIIEISKPLNDEQYAVLSSVVGGKNLFLTGEGGTGKSFTVSIIRAIYDYLGAPYIIVGSTGTSVVNIDGHATFNGMFGIGGGFKKQKDQNGNILPRTLQQWEQLRNDCIDSKRFNSKLKAAKQLTNRCKLPMLAIVDEVSMVESALLSAVEAGLRKLNVKHNWLLVGDVAQFEPVEGVKFFCDDSLYCNRTKKKVAIKSIYNDPEMGFTGFNLKTNVRAKGDTVWAKAMSWVRLQVGTDYPKIIKERWEHSVNNKAPKNALHLAPTNKTVKRFNDEATAKLQAAGAYSKDYYGKFTTSKQIVGLPTDYWLYGSKTDREEGNTIFAPIGFKMTYCIGMRVMLRETNIYDDKGQLLVNNGAQGTVKELTFNAVTVEFDNGLTRTLKAIDMVDPYERGIFTQIPLAPAYALTFNKAQGMTFDFDVIFHMYVETKSGKIMPIFANNAVYVALSRLTSSKHCWFVTNVVSDKGETAYTMFKKAFKASKEAVDFIYDLK